MKAISIELLGLILATVVFVNGCVSSTSNVSNIVSNQQIQNTTQVNTETTLGGRLFEEVPPSQVHAVYINESPELQSFKIQLRNGKIESEPLANYSVLSDVVPDDHVYYILQPKSAEAFRNDYNIMLSDGIQFLEYLPDSGMFVKISQNIIRTKKYDSIRWIGILNKGQKIDEELKKRVGENINSGTLIKIEVEFYEPLDDEQFSIISAFGTNQNLSSWKSYHYMTLEVSPENAEKIAELNFVVWMHETGEVGIA
jgi:hypothetical protein